MLIVLFFLSIVSFCQGLQRPIVIGHRGTAYLPELTIESQSLAHAYGADVIEIDVCLSKDNQLIVIHGKIFIFTLHRRLTIWFRLDLYLDGVTNVNEIYPNSPTDSKDLHYVIDYTLDQIRNLTVHERTVPFNDSQVYPTRFPSTSSTRFQLATLNETLDFILGLNKATGRTRELLIEIKRPEYYQESNRSITSIVLSTLNAYNLTRSTDPIILQTFYIEELFAIRYQLNSTLRLNALMISNDANESSSDYEYYRSEQGIRNLSNVVQALAPHFSFLANIDSDGNIKGPTNFTTLAHKYNLKVYPYTFRRDQSPRIDFTKFVTYFWQTIGVDGFITDHPDVILEILSTNINCASMKYLHSILVLLIFIQFI